jgi:hypothetical protein
MRRGRRSWRWLERSLGLAVARYTVGVMFVVFIAGFMPRPLCPLISGCPPPPGPPAGSLAAVLWIGVTAVGALALVAVTDVVRHAAGWRSRVRDARASMIAPHQWRFPI